MSVASACKAIIKTYGTSHKYSTICIASEMFSTYAKKQKVNYLSSKLTSSTLEICVPLTLNQIDTNTRTLVLYHILYPLTFNDFYLC